MLAGSDARHRSGSARGLRHRVQQTGHDRAGELFHPMKAVPLPRSGWATSVTGNDRFKLPCWPALTTHNRPPDRRGTLLMDFRNILCRIAAGLGLATAGTALAQAPTITAEAEALTTYVGYPATLSLAVASSNGVPNFQWYLLGVGQLPGSFTNVTGATNLVLKLTNLALTNNGAYFAIITNRSGSVTSAPVNLVILAPPVAAVNLGEMTTPTPDTAALQISYASQGTETNISFSISFDGTVLSDPTFEVGARTALPEAPAGITFGQAADSLISTSTHSATNGIVDSFGINLDLDQGRIYPAGERIVGTIRWHIAGNHSAFQGRVGFTNVPAALKSRTVTNGITLDLQTGLAAPQILGRETVPHLDRQSGLYLQQLTIANPGYTDLTNSRLNFLSVPVDAHANQIQVYNSPSRQGTGTIIDLGPIEAGGIQLITLEYFVPDHQGWPTIGSDAILPVISTSTLVPAARVTPPGIGLPDSKVRITRQSAVANAGFTGVLLDFPTQTNRNYYVQYSGQVDFNKTNEIRLVLPALIGTGSTVQWIDNGPPKTESFPTDATTRYYRILEVR